MHLAGMTALLAQMDSQQTLPSMAVSVVADMSGYKSTTKCRNGIWDGYDLTHQCQDDRSTSMFGPNNHTVFEREATLRMPPRAPVQPTAPKMLPPAHIIIQPQLHHHNPSS